VSAENVELARQGFAAVMRGEYDAIAEMLAPGVRWHGGDPDAPGACHNSEEALAFMRRARPMAELVDVVDAGDRVVVVLRAPGDERLHANVTTFRDGKVVEMVHYADAAEALAAVQ
jgi:ketosteroid isomerase-like protein